MHRESYQLVGRAHTLGYWPEPDTRMPKLESARSYYAQELYADIEAGLDARSVLSVNGALVLLLGILPGGLMALCAQAVAALLA